MKIITPIKKILTKTLLVAIVCGVYSFSYTQKAQAMTPVTEDGPALYTQIWTTIESAFSSASEAVQEEYATMNASKELTLDYIAWTVADLLLKQMIMSTTDWVNRGFEGKPYFIQDINSFLLDVGDRYALQFIWDNNLVDLCSPFKINIQLALHNIYGQNRGYEAQCRLSDALMNIENMSATELSDAGGWSAWHELTQDPQNNQYGAFFESDLALSAGVVNTRNQSLIKLNWGQGFHPKERCEQMKSGEGGEASYKKCMTETPGNVIQAQINHALGGGQDRLVVADEINELVGALLGQLMTAVVKEGGGLLGLTQGGGGSQPSYFDQMSAKERNSGVKTLAEEISAMIEEEQAFIANQQAVVGRIQSVQISCAPKRKLAPSLTGNLTAAEENVESANEGIAQLTTMQSALTDTTTPSDIADINTDFSMYMSTRINRIPVRIERVENMISGRGAQPCVPLY